MCAAEQNRHIWKGTTFFPEHHVWASHPKLTPHNFSVPYFLIFPTSYPLGLPHQALQRTTQWTWDGIHIHTWATFLSTFFLLDHILTNPGEFSGKPEKSTKMNTKHERNTGMTWVDTEGPRRWAPTSCERSDKPDKQGYNPRFIGIIWPTLYGSFFLWKTWIFGIWCVFPCFWGHVLVPLLLFFGSVSGSSDSSPYFPRSSGSQSSLIYQPTITHR